MLIDFLGYVVHVMLCAHSVINVKHVIMPPLTFVRDDKAAPDVIFLWMTCNFGFTENVPKPVVRLPK